MNIAESLADYLETTIDLELGVDLFIGEAPSTNKVENDIWWLVARGGTILQENQTGEKRKENIMELWYRARDYKSVYDAMELAEDKLNCDWCSELEDYDVIEIRAEPLFADEDLDSEDRKLGVIQINVVYFDNCLEPVS